MTGREFLRKRARWLLAVMLVAWLPAVVAYGVAVLFATSESNGFVAWCADAWWWLVLVAMAIFFLATLAQWFLLRCPFCRFRFALASITTFALARLSSLIGFCPHCGVDLSAGSVVKPLPPRR